MLHIKNYHGGTGNGEGIRSMCIDLKNDYLFTSCTRKSCKVLHIGNMGNIREKDGLVLTNVHAGEMAGMIINSRNKWLYSFSEKKLQVLEIKPIWNCFRTYKENIDVYDKEDISLFGMKSAAALNHNKIDYFNQRKGLNLFSYNLLQELVLFGSSTKRRTRLKKLLTQCHVKLFNTFSQAKNISLFDIQIMTTAFRLFELDDLIVTFIGTVLRNKEATRTHVLEIFEWLLIL
jgi:hypothetical protein